MKKILILILAVCMIISVAAAETDLQSMSYDELIRLQQEIVNEIISRPEWKEVKVPSGSWTVGKDIPAGEYSLSAGNGGGYIKIRRNGRSIVSQGIRDKDDTFGKIELIDGDVVEIERGSIIFAPPIGLGF